MVSLKYSIVFYAFLFALILFPITGILSQGHWVGQGRVTSENSTYGVSARVAIDSLGNPWVVWVGHTVEHPYYYLICYTKWNGSGWEQQELVVRDDTTDNLMPWIAFDSDGKPWTTWHRYINNRKRDALFSFWDGNGWTPEELIHPPDPDTITNACPRIGAGGGELWAIWVHGVKNTPYIDVYASHWNGSSWDPPMMVNDSNNVGDGHFLQVVVDSDGHPHFCWTRYDTNGIFPYYRMYDGTSFTPEKKMNEPDGGIQGEYLSMAIDTVGNYHFAWAAIMETPPINAYIFYRMYDGQNWSPAACVSVLDSLGNWRPRIAANSPDNIWIAWDGVDRSRDYHIYAVNYDGLAWSEEMRLDSDETYDDVSQSISLDRTGNPWVIWSGNDYSSRQVYYNRWIPTTIDESADVFRGPIGIELSSYPNPFDFCTSIGYYLPHKFNVRLAVYNVQGQLVRTLVTEKEKAGHHTVIWDATDDSGRKVSCGTYFLRLKAGEHTATRKLSVMR